MSWVAEVLVVDPVAPIRAEPDRVDGVAAIGTDFCSESPIGMIGPLVDQPVRRLLGAEPMIVDLLVAVQIEQRIGPSGRLRIAAVEEARAVMGPRGARELDPLQVVAAVLVRRDVADAELLPIGAAAGGAIDHGAPVFRQCQDRQRDGSVLRQRVGIEQHLRLRRERALRVQHGLILEAGVLEEEVAAALLEGSSVFRVVPQLRQAAANALSLGNLLQVGERDSVLRLHPGPGFRRVHILEPAIGVRNLGAVVVLHDVTLAGGRISKGLRIQRRSHQQSQQRYDFGSCHDA